MRSGAVSFGGLRRIGEGLPVLFVLLAVPLVVVAGTVTVPNTFYNTTTADAKEVNENFDAVETAVNEQIGQTSCVLAQRPSNYVM